MESAKVPVGPVKTLDQVFETDQVAARDMVVTMQSGDTPLRLLGNPLKFSRTPVTYRKSPPICGADSDEILATDTPFKDD